MSPSSLAQTTLNRHVGRPIQILLVEDSPSDVAMTRAALKDGP